VFAVFSLATQPSAGAIKWQLLGFPLELNLPLALSDS
jgi:hypothetical protein